MPNIKTILLATGTMVTLFVLLAFYGFAFGASADVREVTERDRGTAGRTTETTINPPAPLSPPISTPPPSSGGITSSTSGSVNTGGNTGGQVTTGDEHVEVYEINIGPTNPPPTPPTPDEKDDTTSPGRTRTR